MQGQTVLWAAPVIRLFMSLMPPFGAAVKTQTSGVYAHMREAHCA